MLGFEVIRCPIYQVLLAWYSNTQGSLALVCVWIRISVGKSEVKHSIGFLSRCLLLVIGTLQTLRFLGICVEEKNTPFFTSFALVKHSHRFAHGACCWSFCFYPNLGGKSLDDSLRCFLFVCWHRLLTSCALVKNFSFGIKRGDRNSMERTFKLFGLWTVIFWTVTLPTTAVVVTSTVY